MTAPEQPPRCGWCGSVLVQDDAAEAPRCLGGCPYQPDAIPEQVREAR